MKTERLQALCDGVFAIAMTLLVLELPVPEDSVHLADDLLDRWPSYAAYVVSFVTIGIVWNNHHVLMDRIQRVDRATRRSLVGPLVYLTGTSHRPGQRSRRLRHLRRSGPVLRDLRPHLPRRARPMIGASPAALEQTVQATGPGCDLAGGEWPTSRCRHGR